MTHRTLIQVCLIALALCTAQSAHASKWSTVAGTCMPDESDTRTLGGVAADWLVWSAAPNEGRVYPGGTGAAATGTVALRCAISNPLDPIPGLAGPAWPTWELTYQDPDGMAAGTNVKLYLCWMAKATGVTTCKLQFDSNSSIAVGVNYVTGAVVGVVPWNFFNNYYFARIVVADTSALVGPPFAFGVGLFD